MNYAKEKFPSDIKELTIKCENLALFIQTKFSDYECTIIKDLYHENK